MSNKSERVYHFLTEKSHRRLCLHKFSYLQYWQNRHNAEQQKQKDPDVKIVRKPYSSVVAERKAEAIGFAFFFAGIVTVSAIVVAIVEWCAR